jgi:uncharacterized protein YbjT (DUF2867 family)
VSGNPFTILRPGYFFQNDAALKAPLTGPGLYSAPIGTAGIAAVDVRDIADAAAVSLTTDGHAGKTYSLVGPAPLSGPGAAAAWAAALGRPVRYAEPPLDAFEEQLRQMVPAWLAMELRLMFQGYQERGFAPAAADVAALTTLIGHAPRRYEDFVHETAIAWGVTKGRSTAKSP